MSDGAWWSARAEGMVGNFGLAPEFRYDIAPFFDPQSGDFP